MAATPTTPRISRSWIDVQKKTFTGWANTFLKERIMKIKEFDTDLQDGINLINLLEVISGKKLPKYTANPKTRFQKIENISIAIKFIQAQGVKLVSIGAEDIADGSVKLTLGLLWTLILRYQISNIESGGTESPKAALLAWCRKRLQPYHIQVNDFDSSWQDGRALCALTDSLKVGCLPLSTLSNDPETDADRAMNTAQDLFGIPKILDAYDLVTIPDDLSIMTYLSYFRDYVVNAEKKADEEKQREEEMRKKTADPAQVYARGSGVEKEGLYANQTASFQIQACNFYGEELNSGGEQFSVKVVGEDGSEVEAPVTDNGDGEYEVRYLPTTPENYTIDVLLNGQHIKDSPFHVKIDGATPENSSADGPGLTQGGSHANKPAVFTITARDSKGQPLDHGGDKFTAQAVRQSDGIALPVSVDDNDDGTYTAVYQPKTSGVYNVEVLLRGTPIAGAPYKTVVYGATPENSLVEGKGLEDGKAYHVASFTVVAVDVDGNKLTSGGEPFEVALQFGSGESKEGAKVVHGEVKDNNDGTYTVEYIPPGPGDYSLETSIFGQPLKDFPKQLHFKPSANGAKSEVSGTGIKNGVAEKPVRISIKAKDIDGAPRTDGGDSFNVVFEHNSGDKLNADVIDNGDGSYDVDYVLSRPGDYKVHVLLDNGVPVADSPYNVYVKPLPSPANTYADGKGLTSPFDNAPAVFTIHAVDDSGNPIKEGGDEFDVILQTPSGEPLAAPTIVDNDDGTYTVTYRADQPGDYSADVRVGGKSIGGFPRTVTVREGTEGVVSEFGKFAFTVVARDKRNVVKTFGGDPFEVTIKGTSEALSVTATDNADGTYTASYTVGVGKYWVSVVLNGKEVVGSPFVQKVGSVGKGSQGVHTSSASTNN